MASSLTDEREKPPPPPAAVALEDPAESMQCSDHPYRSNPGGICAFCLQEKLGKLVSSSNTSTPFFSSSASLPSSSSSFSPSPRPSSSFHLKTKPPPPPPHPNPAAGAGMLKRSKSVAPRPVDGLGTTDSPRKKSFWFFLSSKNSAARTDHQNEGAPARNAAGTVAPNTQTASKIGFDNQQALPAAAATAAAESPASSSSSSFGRKVARSRSVGCGSRSFSGDFLERISTGFGDCTLRRVESHRESNNNKMVAMEERRMKERVKCGGIFAGFGIISTSASSYWLSAAAAVTEEEDDFDGGSCRTTGSRKGAVVRGGGGTGRSRSWAWALASPMRAFKPASASEGLGSGNAISSINAANGGGPVNLNGKIGGGAGNGNGNGNPSLLAVGS